MENPQKAIDEAWKKSISLLKNDSRITARQRGFLQYAKATDIAGNVIIIKVANEVTQDVLQTQIKNVFEETLRSAFGTNISCAYVIDPGLEIKDQTVENLQEKTEPDVEGNEKNPPRKTQNKSDETGPTGRLNPKYTFDSFVRGHSNRFAHAAALAVAEAPGQAYNPLFIYGDSGLGKTHLLHAIGNYSHKVSSEIRVRYVNAEEFTNDFINSIRDDEGVGFKTTYRNVDILLMDDIQFFSGKDRTQEEFFHTFNTLHNMGKQIVITSDLPPKQLRGFEDRMRTRFEWGLITDVQPPELETRIAILRKKAIIERLNIDDETLEYIATHVTTNIRKLEGALIRVAAFANLNRQKASTELAETVLKDLITNENASEITISTILAQTAEHFNLSIEEMKSTSRTRHLVTARQIAMYLCRELTSMSLPMIGQEFGGRDHTTVMHADRKIRELLQEKREIFNQVTELTNKIKNQQQI